MTRLHLKLACFGALLFFPAAAMAQTLGAAQDFAIVGGSAVTAAVGATPSQVIGDVGVSPGTSITGFPPALGAVVVPPYVLHPPNDGPSIAAQAAVTALFTSLSTAGGAATTIPDQLAGQSRGPWRIQPRSGEPRQWRRLHSFRRWYLHFQGVELADHNFDVEHLTD